MVAVSLFKNEILKTMSRILAYLLISGLLAVGIYAGYMAFRVDDKPIKDYTVTRSGVDSLQFEAYTKAQVRNVPTKEPFRWSEFTSAVVALAVAFGTISQKRINDKIDRNHTESGIRFDDIDETLRSVADQKNRDNIDQRLVKIEQDAAGFVDDEKVKALIVMD